MDHIQPRRKLAVPGLTSPRGRLACCPRAATDSNFPGCSQVTSQAMGSNATRDTQPTHPVSLIWAIKLRAHRAGTLLHTPGRTSLNLPRLCARLKFTTFFTIAWRWRWAPLPKRQSVDRGMSRFESHVNIGSDKSVPPRKSQLCRVPWCTANAGPTTYGLCWGCLFTPPGVVGWRVSDFTSAGCDRCLGLPVSNIVSSMSGKKVAGTIPITQRYR